MAIQLGNSNARTYLESLEALKAGNKRYVDNISLKRESYVEIRQELENEQNPFAVIFTCSDSRVVPEIFFDQSFGDLFTLRNAGNVLSEDILASIEYAVSNLRVPLIVVCGHTNCGAISTAYNNLYTKGNLKKLVNKIKKSSKNEKTELDLMLAHINNTVKEIERNDLVKEYEAAVCGAFYDIKTGKITWI